jgi:hypothetical protein
MMKLGGEISRSQALPSADPTYVSHDTMRFKSDQ